MLILQLRVGLMHHNKGVGTIGENHACAYLEKAGFKIIRRNYRYKRAEIDVIASSEGLLLFVEVKYRSTHQFGYPEDFVSSNQVKKILEAAEAFIEEFDWNKAIRFDIIAIDSKMRIEHFEDAFH